MRKYIGTMLLWMLGIVSVFLVLKTSNEPILSIFINTWVEKLFSNIMVGNSIIFNFSLGFLVSLFFYILVVWLPNKERKNLIKKNMEEQYRSFRLDTIKILLLACNGSYTPELPKKLVGQEEFKEYFNENMGERWSEVLNGLNKSLLAELLSELEILMNEVSYVLNNIDIKDPDIYSFFKRLSQSVYKMRNTTLENNEITQLASFLWSLFTGYSFEDSYSEEDIIAKMIASI